MNPTSLPLTLLAPLLLLSLAPGGLAQVSKITYVQSMPPSVEEVPDGGKVQIQFPNTPVSDVLDIYERLIKKSVVADSQIYRGPNVNLMPSEAVTREEACRLIESALLLNGYLLVPGPDGSVKVVLNDPKIKQNPLRDGLAIYTSPGELPEGDGVGGYFLKLDYLSPNDAKAIFESHVQLNSYGRITPVYAPPALLITENFSLIRYMLEIKPLVDVDLALSKRPVKTELVEIRYAEARQVAEMVQALIENRRPNFSGNSSAPAAQKAMQQSRQILGQGQLLMINAQLIPDERTNRILVVTDPGHLEYILDLVASLDQPLELKPPLERSLQYVTAEEVLPVLVNILSEAGEAAKPIRPGGALASQLGIAGNRSNARGGKFTGAMGESSAPPDQLTDPTGDTSPLSVLIGKTRLIADRQSNSILVVGPPESYDKVNTIIDRLDRKPPQVYLATIIGQLTLGDSTELGVDYLLHFKKDKPMTGGLLSAEGLLNSVTDMTTAGITKAVPPMGGLTVFGSVTNNLDVLVRALESTRRFKVLSRPTVYAANNKKAVITSGQQIPVPTNILTSLDSNSSRFQTNITYRDVVLKLEVVPLINSNNEVTLQIAQVNDTITGQQTVSGNSVPIIGTERLNTTVSIPNAHTVVLGGLITEQLEQQEGGIPLLRRIPVLGHAFKSTSRSKVRKELVIFIQPVVVNDDRELSAASHSEDLRTAVGLDAAAIFPPPDQVVPRETVEVVETVTPLPEPKKTKTRARQKAPLRP